MPEEIVGVVNGDVFNQFYMFEIIFCRPRNTFTFLCREFGCIGTVCFHLIVGRVAAINVLEDRELGGRGDGFGGKGSGRFRWDGFACCGRFDYSAGCHAH